jgi:hypothetical protein
MERPISAIKFYDGFPEQHFHIWPSPKELLFPSPEAGWVTGEFDEKFESLKRD